MATCCVPPCSFTQFSFFFVFWRIIVQIVDIVHILCIWRMRRVHKTPPNSKIFLDIMTLFSVLTFSNGIKCPQKSGDIKLVAFWSSGLFGPEKGIIIDLFKVWRESIHPCASNSNQIIDAVLWCDGYIRYVVLSDALFPTDLLKPALLTIVPICQIRYKNTNSGAVTQSSWGHLPDDNLTTSE